MVLDDADPAAVVAGARGSVLFNNGQVCAAQTRIIATPGSYDATVDALADCFEGMVLGDPLDERTEVGPVVTRAQRDKIRDFISGAPGEGAKIAVGGAEAPVGFERGWFIRPTLLVDVDNTSRAAREEIFGPVLCVIRAEDERDAVTQANDSDYGLAGSVWTADAHHGFDVARQIRSGSIAINSSTPLDPALPFGGMKASGTGRELGPEGLAMFSETKTVLNIDT